MLKFYSLLLNWLYGTTCLCGKGGIRVEEIVVMISTSKEDQKVGSNPDKIHWKNLWPIVLSTPVVLSIATQILVESNVGKDVGQDLCTSSAWAHIMTEMILILNVRISTKHNLFSVK